MAAEAATQGSWLLVSRTPIVTSRRASSGLISDS